MKRDLKTFTKSKADYLGEHGVYPDETVLNIFVDLAESRNYTQILFEFGKQYLEVILAFYQDQEEYLLCAEIIKHVNEYNLIRNTDIKLEI